jgi:hypothetical protein
MPAPRLHLTFDKLPPGMFARVPKASKLMRRRPWMVRRRASKAGIAIKVDRPGIGGVEWAIHEKGAAALPTRDSAGAPGTVRAAQRAVEVFSSMTEGCMPYDTGTPCDARRAVANLDTGNI